MTKEEYRDRYGRHDACMCNNCGEYFPVDDLEAVYEPHGEETPICPNCHGDDISYDVYIEEEEDE